jgi:peroxiredoxin
MLSDPERRVIKEYNVYNSSERGGIAIPAVFIIDRFGTVRYARVKSTVFRARTRKLLAVVRKLR